MVRKQPDGPWEGEVLPYPPEQLNYGLTLRIRIVSGYGNVYSGEPCQGITAGGTIFNLKLVDSMFIAGGEADFPLWSFVVIVTGISYDNATKLVRLIHTPDQEA